MNKNLLVIAYYYPPMGLSGVQRIVKFTKYLREYDWNPIILTSSDPYYAYDESLLADIEGIEIFRTPSKKSKSKVQRKFFPGYLKQSVGRYILQMFYQPDSKIKWLRQAVSLGEEIFSKYEINAILSTAPPYTDFLVAKELSEKFKKPFIVDYRDIWVDNPFNAYPTPFHKNHSIQLESEILNKAKKAIVTTRFAKETLIKRYRFLSHEDVVIIPHGYDPEDISNFKDVKPAPSKFVITHSGLFQDNRTPKYFLAAMASFLKKQPEAKKHLEARFVGMMRQSHLKLISKYKLEKNVVATGYLSHDDSLRQIMESDVLWLMLRDTVRSPGKLYEYFGTGKPLLVSVPDGVIARTAQEYRASVVTLPDDIRSIEKAIESFYDQWKTGSLPKPDMDFVNQFDRRRLSSDLARELSLVADL